jgi:hypothetical protein
LRDATTKGEKKNEKVENQMLQPKNKRERHATTKEKARKTCYNQRKSEEDMLQPKQKMIYEQETEVKNGAQKDETLSRDE